MPHIRLITRGDDCGSNHTANLAIREAFQRGLLRNTSLMAPCAATEEAAEMLAAEKALCCGLHCTITAEWERVRWGPVLDPASVPALVDEHGHFLQTTRALHERQVPVEQVMAELHAQLDRARALGFDVRYADQHMVFGWIAEGLEEAIDEWCEKEGILNARHYGGRLPDVHAEGDPVAQLVARLDAAPSGQYLVVGHPAYDNEEMRALGHEGYPGSTIGPERDWQRRFFTDPRMLSYCETHDIVPIRYDEAEPN